MRGYESLLLAVCAGSLLSIPIIVADIHHILESSR